MGDKKPSLIITGIFNMMAVGASSFLAVGLSVVPYTAFDAAVVGGLGFSLATSFSRGLMNAPYLGLKPSFERHFSDHRSVCYALWGGLACYMLRIGL